MENDDNVSSESGSTVSSLNSEETLDEVNSGGHQQFPRYLPFQVIAFSPEAMAAIMPQYNQRHLQIRPPTITDLPTFVNAWEGILVERRLVYQRSIHQVRVLRKPSSPGTLTAQWRRRLEIIIFLPTTAVDYTTMTYGGPMDYVFFHIAHSPSVDLHDHLVTKNLCAKIRLPSQTVVLSPTVSKHHFLGAIFPGDVVFIEPL